MPRRASVFYNSISSYFQYCEGHFNGGGGNRYIIGVQLSTAKTDARLSHAGSDKLDRILSFDKAEVAGANLGQINMIKVSSFCGPGGLIWGYDICPINKSDYYIGKVNDIPIYNIEFLNIALARLFGTVEEPRFPIFPGSHVPCATKMINSPGPCRLYAAEGIGIPADRESQACLLMEDAGFIPIDIIDIRSYKIEILKKLAQSILAVGRNQRVGYNEILVGIKEKSIGIKEFGCALLISPYFKIAQAAIPRKRDILSVSLDEWEYLVKDNYLYKSHGYS